MKKKIFLLSVFLLLPIFSSSFAETQKKYEFEGMDINAEVFCYSTIKNIDKIIELSISNQGHKYVVFDKKQFDRLEILRVGAPKTVYAAQPVGDEVFIINPVPADMVYIRFPIPGVEYFPLSRGGIKEMKLILNRGSLEIILKPRKLEKKK